MKRSYGIVAVLIFVFAVVFTLGNCWAQAQRGGQAARPASTMDSTPQTFDTREYAIRVVTVAEGLSYPYCFAFLPDGSMLLSEMEGRLRIIRDGKPDPEPIRGTPPVHYVPGRGGLMDIAIHPKFEENNLVYFTYDKPGEKGSTTTVARGTLEGHQLNDVEDIFVAEAWGTANGHLSARIAFGRDDMLYMAIADHNLPEDVTKGNSHAGKVLRLHDDGTPPATGPFGAGYLPEIYATGFRDPHSLVLDPETDDFWEVEHGDEVNIVKAGANYGWPYISTGEGNPIGPPPAGVEMTDPYVKQFPVYHFSGLMIYTGDRFPKWKGNVFVGCLSTQEIHRVVRGRDGPSLRESLFTELGQEVRDVRQGPDGLIYFTTNDPSGRVMRIEPIS